MSLALLAAGPMSAQDTDEESPNTVVYRVGDNNLFANVGYGYISSKITGEGTGPLHHGVDVRIGYDRALGRGNGIGVLASMFTSSVSRGGYTDRFSFYYFGPQYVLNSIRDDSRWTFGMRMGLGPLIFVESFSGGGLKASDSVVGLSGNLEFYAGFRVSPEVILTATIGDYYGRFKQYGAEISDDYDSDWSTMERYTINIGLVYNF